MAGRQQKATEAAQERAEEREVDIEKVEGTGSGGTVTAQDVEEQAAAVRAEEQSRHRVVLNPRLGPNLEGVEAGGRFFRGGEPLTDREFEELNTDHGLDYKPLLKGAEVS